MSTWPSGCLLAAWVSPQAIWGALWFGLGLLTIALVTLMATRWGQAQPLSKCIVLSVWAHVLMAVYASGVNIVFKPAPPPPIEIGIHITDAAGPAGEASRTGPPAASASEPWSQFPSQPPGQIAAAGLVRAQTETAITRPTLPVIPKSSCAASRAGRVERT